MIRKLANFTTDSIIFSMKEQFEESRNDIARLAVAFKKEPAFKFSEPEMTYFERLYRILDPKPKAKRHMSIAMEYLNKHVCESASSLKPKPKE